MAHRCGTAVALGPSVGSREVYQTCVSFVSSEHQYVGGGRLHLPEDQLLRSRELPGGRHEGNIFPNPDATFVKEM